MNQPWIYMCSPSLSPLPPPFPSHIMNISNGEKSWKNFLVNPTFQMSLWTFAVLVSCWLQPLLQHVFCSLQGKWQIFICLFHPKHTSTCIVYSAQCFVWFGGFWWKVHRASVRQLGYQQAVFSSFSGTVSRWAPVLCHNHGTPGGDAEENSTAMWSEVGRMPSTKHRMPGLILPKVTWIRTPALPGLSLHP